MIKIKPQEIAPDIYDVGIIDWDNRDFHGYYTPRGVTYNSYLIMDEKRCLIDTVKAPFTEEFVRNIEKVTDVSALDYIIVNHVEPDHSGALPRLAELAPQATLFLPQQGKNEVLEHYGDHFNFQVVKEGDTLSLGKRTLEFLPLPMIHWPDSMSTYLQEEQILFSNDVFGQHYCTGKRFDDEIDEAVLFFEAQKYFANIIYPYANLIPRVLTKINRLPVRLIAPAHGAIWRRNIEQIKAKYAAWGSREQDNTVIIAYETMWGGTEKMARAIAAGVTSAGLPVKFYRLNVSDNSEIVAELLTAGAMLFGSSTLNSGMLPKMGELLTYLKGLQPKGKIAAAFGTFGWNGGAQRDMEELIVKAGFELTEGLNCKWKPLPEEIVKAEEFGYNFAQALKK